MEVEFEFYKHELSRHLNLGQQVVTAFSSVDQSTVIEIGFRQLELVVNEHPVFSVETKQRPHWFLIQDLIDMINAATPVHQIHIKVTELE